MSRHRHLRPADAEHMLGSAARRLRVKDINLQYMQGVVDGALLAYLELSLCPDCVRALSEFTDRVDGFERFLTDSSSEDLPYKLG